MVLPQAKMNKMAIRGLLIRGFPWELSLMNLLAAVFRILPGGIDYHVWPGNATSALRSKIEAMVGRRADEPHKSISSPFAKDRDPHM